MYVHVNVNVHVHTLGAHFGLAAPSAVQLPAARTLSPGVKMAWTTQEDVKKILDKRVYSQPREGLRRVKETWMKVGNQQNNNSL